MTQHKIGGEGQLDPLAVTNQPKRVSRNRCKKHIEGQERKSIALDSIYIFTDLPASDHLSYGLLRSMQFFLTTCPLSWTVSVMTNELSRHFACDFYFFWWKTENSLVWIKKTIFVVGVKLIKTMLFHCPSNMDLRVYKQLLFLVKWNTVQQYFNSILPDYQLFQASVKISITGKMNYVLFVKLAPTCPSSWAGKDSLTVQHRCYCLWLINAPESKFCSYKDLLLCKRFLFSDKVSK